MAPVQGRDPSVAAHGEPIETWFRAACARIVDHVGSEPTSRGSGGWFQLNFVVGTGTVTIGYDPQEDYVWGLFDAGYRCADGSPASFTFNELLAEVDGSTRQPNRVGQIGRIGRHLTEETASDAERLIDRLLSPELVAAMSDPGCDALRRIEARRPSAGDLAMARIRDEARTVLAEANRAWNDQDWVRYVAKIDEVDPAFLTRKDELRVSIARNRSAGQPTEAE